MSIFGKPYKQVGTAADGTPIWELGPGFDSEYDSLPSSGWLYRPGQGGGADVDPTPETWSNLATGGRSTVNPASVKNPFYSVGSISAQGEGAVTENAYVNNDPYEPYRSYMSQVFTGDARGMGQIQGDPNFNWAQYFDPLPAGTRVDQALPQANAGIQKLVEARPDLTIRAGPWGSGFVPWQNMDDYSRRNDYFNPGEGFFEGMFDYAGEVAGDLWNTPLPAMAAMAAGVGYANGAFGGAAGTAGGATGAASGAGVGGGLGGGVGLNPLAGGVGLNPAAAGVGFQATPSAVAAFEAGINVPGLTAGAGLGAGSLAGGGATGGAPLASGAGIGGAATTGSIPGILSNPMVVGSLGGAALGGLSGAGTEQGTITVEEGIPDWLMPYMKPTMDRYATDIQNHQVDPYGILPSAMQEFQKTISGQYLDPSTNKYLEDYFKLGAERIKGSLSPSFGHMQAFGAHSGYNEALARGLGDFSTTLFGGAYERERDRQNQMIAQAPSFLAGSSTAAFTPYQQYLGTLGSLGKKKEDPFFTNPWGSVLGGALSGGMLGGMFGNSGKK